MSLLKAERPHNSQAVKDKASAETRAKEAEMAMEAAEAERLKALSAFMSQVSGAHGNHMDS